MPSLKAGTLTKQKLSQRSQDRKAEAHKVWGGTQKSRDPNRTKCCPKEARTVKHTMRGEGPRETGSLTKQKLSQRSRDSKAHNKGGGTQRRRVPNKTKAVPEKPGQKNRSTQRMGRDPEKPGSKQNRNSQRSREAAAASALEMHSMSDIKATLSSGASKSPKPCISRKEGKGPR